MTGSWGMVRRIETGAEPNRQNEVQGEFILTNSGPQESPRYGIRFYLAAGPRLTKQDTLLESVLAAPLRPGEHSTITIQKSLLPGTVAAGKYLIAVMNPTHTVLEADEAKHEISVGPLP
jgi:hypothetical protein